VEGWFANGNASTRLWQGRIGAFDEPAQEPDPMRMSRVVSSYLDEVIRALPTTDIDQTWVTRVYRENREKPPISPGICCRKRYAALFDCRISAE